MRRTDLLTAMRGQLGRDGSEPSELPRWRPPAELFIADLDERVRRFVARLSALGAKAEVVGSRDEAHGAVERLLNERGWAALSCSPDLAWPALAGRCSDDLAGVPFGLCMAQSALAETGTVVVATGGTHRRGTSLLPPAVGFFVRRSTLVSRLTEFLAGLDADSGALPASVVLISGPSRSADIGSVVCRGVHGPGEVHVWVIDGE